MGISVIGDTNNANNFSIDVGASGNNVIILNKEYSAGAYSITSQLADASLDIYAINSDGSLSGYTNTKALSCSRGFSKIVVLGATSNDLLTFEYKTTFSPTEAGTVGGAGAYITSISPTDLPEIDDIITINGGNFATDVEVTFTGTNSVELNAKSIVRVSSTQLLVTRPDNLLQDNSPYDLKVLNPGINPPTSIQYIVSNGVTAGGDPTWVTNSGSLPLGIITDTYTTTLSATDPDGGAISYSLVSGSIPPGLSLNSSTGVISGAASSAGTYSFTAAATDSGGNITNRSFSIEILDGMSSTTAVLYPSQLVLAGHTASGNYWLKGNGTTAYQVYCYYDGSSFWARTANIPRGSNIEFNGYTTTSNVDFRLENSGEFFNLSTNTFGNSTGTNLDVMLRIVGGTFSGAVATTPGIRTKTVWRGVDLNAALTGTSTGSVSSSGASYSNDGGQTWTAFSGGNFVHANGDWNWVISTTDGNPGAYNNSSINGWILHGQSGNGGANILYAFTEGGIDVTGNTSWSTAELYVRI